MSLECSHEPKDLPALQAEIQMVESNFAVASSQEMQRLTAELAQTSQDIHRRSRGLIATEERISRLKEQQSTENPLMAFLKQGADFYTNAREKQTAKATLKDLQAQLTQEQDELAALKNRRAQLSIDLGIAINQHQAYRQSASEFKDSRTNGKEQKEKRELVAKIEQVKRQGKVPLFVGLKPLELKPNQTTINPDNLVKMLAKRDPNKETQLRGELHTLNSTSYVPRENAGIPINTVLAFSKNLLPKELQDYQLQV